MRTFVYMVMALVLGAVVVLGGLYGWNQYQSVVTTAVSAPVISSSTSTPSANYQNGQNSYQALLINSPTFDQAIQDLAARNYNAALPLFQSSLKDARDPLQEGRVELYIALVTSEVNNGAEYLQAIPLYKQIATNPALAPITRAYAVQAMGLLFYLNADPAVTKQIFSSEPYTSLYVASDTAVSYRNLFQHAAQMYPLGISEARVASWYALQILNSTNASPSSATKLSADTIQSYKTIIKNDLQAANADVARIATQAGEQSYTPYILEREAVVIAYMQESGDTSFGDIDAAFKATLRSYAIFFGGTAEDGFARYKYAESLNRLYGTSRLSDIENVLAPLYTDPVYKNSAIEHFLAGERVDTTGDKRAIVGLAGVDPAFKSYLETLGWSAADLASK